MKPTEQKDIPFPNCYKNCGMGQHFGVGECESICPDKFDKDGNAINPIKKEECNERKTS